MANTATAQTALGVRVHGVGVDVVPYLVAIDTPDTDLTIVTPAGGAMAVVVGLMYSEADAQTLTFKSATTIQVAFELAPYSSLFLPMGNQVYVVTQPGEALKIRSSATISSLLIYVAQTSRVVF